MITKPMLAGKCTDITKLCYPVLATPKLDGIRCLVINGKAVSRKFKPIPNDYIRHKIEDSCGYYQLDGEIMIEGQSFNELSGDVRRQEGAPDFYYAVFDYNPENWTIRTPYEQRMIALERLLLPAFCRKILPSPVSDVAMLQAYEAEQLAKGYEGIMVRSPSSPYKCGRSTENEGYLLKIKRFEDSEAVVVHVEEEMENQNVATKDAFGRTERSAHKENKAPKGTLGVLECRLPSGVIFKIGTGFDAVTRLRLWQHRDRLISKIVKFKHQPSGADEKPRFPVYLGFRDEWDL